MASVCPQDRVSLCRFTFSDGRKCLTPRAPNHPHFCYFHARSEARSAGAEKLARDFQYLFSAPYLSANDLNAAIGRLFPAVVRGDVKPRTASTLAYLAQTLSQTIPIAQKEYIYAFSAPDWGKVIRTSVNQVTDYTNNPDPPVPQSSPEPEPVPEPQPESDTPSSQPATKPLAGLEPDPIPTSNTAATTVTEGGPQPGAGLKPSQAGPQPPHATATTASAATPSLVPADESSPSATQPKPARPRGLVRRQTPARAKKTPPAPPPPTPRTPPPPPPN